ncbi:ferredoxin [Streptomyces sp. NP160]|nr:ferredoxin [Streptomyces sp. NP160]
MHLTPRAVTGPDPDSGGTSDAGAVAERVHVDWTRCDGRGLCTELLGELLAEDDWGYPVSTTGEVAPAVPRRLQRAARLAVAECPRMALSLRGGDALPQSAG